MTTSSRLARLLTPSGAESAAGSAAPPVARGSRCVVDDDVVAAAVRGRVAEPGVVVVDTTVALASRHGRIPLSAVTTVGERGSLGVTGRDATTLLFLDTETTGLAGGTGTLAFLLGLARLDGPHLVVRQLLLTGFGGEGRLLELARPWLDAAGHVVTYNGKSFDVPLLITRHQLRRITCALSQRHQVDLLHPTRTAFGRRWPDCRLVTTETRLLGFQRSDDLPSARVPEVWSALVRRGALTDLSRVLEHNRHDLLTMVALLPALAAVFDHPDDVVRTGADALAVARHHLRRGHEAAARDHLACAAGRLDPDGLLELARLHRRAGDVEQAVAVWHELADQDVPLALEHLAKYHEHVRHDPSTALDYTERLAVAGSGDDVPRRRRRLTDKVARAS